MNRSVEIAKMTWTEYDARVKKENPIVIIPVGSLEQHGPHTPLGTDTLIPCAISITENDASRRHGLAIRAC